MAENRAAWILAPKAYPLTVQDAPTPEAGPGQIDPASLSLSFAQAVVLPLAVSTACAGLYLLEYLELPLPSPTNVTPTGQWILVWGGASSVGATTIQLAIASGLTVLTTASPANHDFVKSLGAHVVLDYRSATIADDIASVLPADNNFIGVYDAIAEESSFTIISKILNHLGRAVPVVSVLPYGGQPTERFAPKFVMASSIDLEPHEYIGEYIWGIYLPQALANGSFQAEPDPYVVGHGIESIQHASDIQKKGLSAKKVAVTL